MHLVINSFFLSTEFLAFFCISFFFFLVFTFRFHYPRNYNLLFFFFLMIRPPPRSTLFPYRTHFRSRTGRDLANLALAAMRLQAQIDRQIDDYQKRPRTKFIGANAAEYRFAQYEEEWRAKVERIGTVNYPAEARGKLYGNLRLTVSIRPDGSVDSVELDRSSGLKVLDAAAFRIVRMAAPYATFPASIRRDTDLLVITRTWFFSQGDKIWTQ